MDALIDQNKKVVCPYCRFDQFIVIRRRLKNDRVLIKTCRCEACGDTFEFEVDREGVPITDKN